MKIYLSPIRHDNKLSIVKKGDVLVVNGDEFDFGPIPEGGTLPLEAIDSDYFCGPVERIGGELIVNLLLPHGPSPSQAAAFPSPIAIVNDGVVELPQ
jgi:hypothetical protein